MEYVVIENNLIKGLYDAPEIPEGAFPARNFRGQVGQEAAMFDWDDEGTLRPIDDLVAEGFVEDNRGTYYTKDIGKPIHITEPGVPVPEWLTTIAPTSDWDEWDEQNQQWVLNSAAEQANLTQRNIDMAQDAVDAELAEACNAIIRWMEERFTIPSADYDFVDAMTDINDVKIAITGVLDKLRLDAGDVAFITSWKDKYDAWVAAKG